MDLEDAKKRFWEEHREKDQQDFNRLSAAESILDLKYQTDSLLITELLANWIGKAKNENQKKILLEAIGSMMRISSYVDTLQTVSKESTIRYLKERRESNRLLKSNTELKKSNEVLDKMIKDYEKGRL